MDWLFTLTLIYVVVTLPFTSVGFITVYAFSLAFLSAKEDRKAQPEQ